MELMRSCGLCACLAITSCGQMTMRSADDKEPVLVRLPSSMITEDFVRETSFIQDHGTSQYYTYGYVAADKVADIKDVEILSQEAYIHGAYSKLPVEPDLLAPSEPYHDYGALTAELEKLTASHSDIAELLTAGKTTQGRELWYVRITKDVSEASDRPKLLYISSMHGDEVAGKEMMIYLIRLLTGQYGKDPEITSLVNNAEIFIMPLMNPDGNTAKRRWNANSVDLNRNFPDFTRNDRDVEDHQQVETKAIMALHAKHHFHAALNFHGGAVCVNMPWDGKRNQSPSEKFGDSVLMETLSHAYANRNTTMRANHGGNFDHGVTYGYEWYPVYGGMQDWSIHYRHSFHATVELSDIKWPSEKMLPKIWEENRDSLLGFLKSSLLGVHLQIVNPQGNPVTGATVALSSSNRNLPYNLTNFAHRHSVAGKQTVTVSAPGYKDARFVAEAVPFTGEFQEVILQPE